MMLLKQLTMSNFGPYRGSHVVKFKAASNELILVHGENMAGKTSFLNSIRWCLYGIYKDRSGSAMPLAKIVNFASQAEDQFSMSVEIEASFEDEGGVHSVLLKRHVQKKKASKRPATDAEYEQILAVQVDGDVYPQDQFDDVVNSLMPERISRFFLFDGELLKEYEELVHEDSSTHAHEVKEAIEMILGVPAVLNGRDDLSLVLKEASKEHTKEAKRHRQSESDAKQAEVLQEEISDLETDYLNVKQSREQAQAGLKMATDALETYEHLRSRATELKAIQGYLSDLDASDLRLATNRKKAVANLWRDVIHVRLRNETDRMNEEREQMQLEVNNASRIRMKLGELRDALSDKECPTCHQPIPAAIRDAAQTQVDGLESELQSIVEAKAEKRYEELGVVIRRMSEVYPGGVMSEIRTIESELQENRISRHKKNQELKRAEDALADFDPKVMEEYDKKKSDFQRATHEADRDLDELRLKLEAKNADLLQVQRRIKQSATPALKRLETQLEVTRGAKEIFDATIDDLIEMLRKDVETEASRIFRELTTDKSYSGLEINENYGLTILGADGKKIPVRSAGAEQIVALSLIGALNRLAAKRGPVIMDTPFGRLDRKHRDNILRFAPTLADQVVLLVHSGEIDPERDLNAIKGMVSSELDIEHINSTESKITRKSIAHA